MKRLVLTAALSLALSGPLAVAQEPATPPPPPTDAQGPPRADHPGHRRAPDPHREAMMLSKHLNLTTDQTTKLEPILADRQSRVEALRSNTSLDEQSRHQQMHAIQQDTETKLASVLTPDQLQQMKEMHGKMGRHGRGGLNGPGGSDQTPPPPPPTE